MVRGRAPGFDPPHKAEPFRPWKPDVCEEPGCTARHPSFSRDGLAGPCRCRAHDQVAQRKSPDLGPLL